MLIANTNKQDLTQHCVTVGKLAVELLHSFRFNFNAIEIGAPYVDENELAKAIQMGAQDGDLGKALQANQDYFQGLLSNNEGYEPDTGESAAEFIQSNPLHHEISYILSVQKSQQFKTKLAREAYLYAVYWHHAKPLREKDNIWNETWQRIVAEKDGINTFFNSHDLLNSACNLDDIEQDTYKAAFVEKTGLVFKHQLDWSQINKLRKLENPKKDALKHVHEKFHANTINTVSRLMAIIADRTVSKLTAVELNHVFNGKIAITDLLTINDHPHIKVAVDRYLTADGADSARSGRQEKAATELAILDSNVCNGAPGVGKTRIALSAYSKRQQSGACKRLLWICPRIDVCLNVLEELSQCLPELTVQIHTGEHQYSYKNGKVIHGLGDYDIKITTTDQVCSKLLKHAKADEMLEYLQSSIVFDEFHETLTDSTFIPHLYELVWLKAFQSDRDLTLISGTVAPMHLSLLGGYFESGIVGCPTFNQSECHYTYINNPEQNHETFAAVKGNWIVFQNKVLGVQRVYLDQVANNKSDGLIYHSKFNAQDRRYLFEKINESFGKGSTNDGYTLLNAGPAARASLNISRENLMAECTDPETQAQQDGRKNRFGEVALSESIYLLGETRYDKKAGLWKIKDGTLTRSNQAFVAFYYSQFMRFNLHGKTVKAATFNECYEQFYTIWSGSVTREQQFDLAAALTAWTMENTCRAHDVLIPYASLRDFAIKAIKASLTMKGREKTAALNAAIDSPYVPDDKKFKLALLKFITFPNTALAQFEKAMSFDFISFLENVAKKMAKQSFEPTKSLINQKGQVISKLNLRGNSVYANGIKSIWAQGDATWNDTTEYIGDLSNEESLFTLSVDDARDHVGQHIQRLQKMDPEQFKKIRNQARYGKKDAGIEQITLWNAETPEGAIYASILASESINTFEPVNYMVAETTKGSIPVGYFDCNKLLIEDK